MTTLLAWVWTPVLVYVLLLGVGLLVDSLLRTDLPPALLAPTGMAVAVVVLTPVYRLGAGAAVAAPLLLLAAIVGCVLARRGLRERVWAPGAMIAAGVVYVLYMAPVLLSGEPTWGGYNFVNDTASNFILIDLLEGHGATVPTGTSSTVRTGAYLVGSGYPLGSFSLVASLRPLTGAPVETVYQPVLSVFAALAAMSLTELGRRSGLRAGSAVAAAILAVGGVLVYRYTLHGAIKEIALVAVCATAAALGTVALERRLATRTVALLALVAIAMVLVFSAAAGAYALALGLAVLAAAMLSPDRPSLRHVARLAGTAAVVGGIVLLPTLGSALDFAGTIRSVFAASGGASTGMLGQLVRPLPVSEVAGIWATQDYRLPVTGPFSSLNAVLIGLTALAAIGGIAFCVVRRRWGPLVLLVAAGLPALALSPAASPYIDGKLMMVSTPGVVFMAAFGALSAVTVARTPVRLLGAAGLLVVAVGVLVSDLYGYRDTRLAPAARVEAMKQVAGAADGKGLYLLNEWEEYGKYFMRAARVNAASEAEALRPVRLRRPAPIFGRYFDLDLQTLPYVEGFRGVIMRRSPVASRPPAGFRLSYTNHYYELWKRDPRVRVRAHLPLGGADRAADVPDCSRVRALARGARPGDRLVAARRAPVARLSPLLARRPRAWPPSPETTGAVTPTGAGTVEGTLGAEGRRRVWLKMTGGRAVHVLVDGREVGAAREVNTPDQWVDMGTVELGAGSHRIEMRRGSVSWRPGDAYLGSIGSVALQGTGPGALVATSARRPDRLCGRAWDWVEVVKPSR